MRMSKLKPIAIYLPQFHTIKENDELKMVLEKMEQDNVWILPVLTAQNQYLGFVSKAAIFNKYRALLMRQNDYMG